MALLPSQSDRFPNKFQEKIPPDNFVALAKSLRSDYGMLEEPVAAPELPERKAATVALATLRELFRIWGFDASNFGSSQWNPLGSLISAGSKVVLKPNWVLHTNKSGCGMDCLVTHATVIEAVLDYVALAHPGSVVLGDSPVQGCDFEALRAGCAVDPMVARFRERGMNLSICDFRRTLLPGENLGHARIEAVRGLEHFILFDLKRESLLEPLGQDASKFRVTMYDPDLMFKTHSPGRHQYLIAREIIEADTILNLPKLKTHKKACLTGALKNMVGINGHKEYLPHHRKGGSSSGGDCYAGASIFKSAAESLLDAANRSHSGAKQSLLAKSAGAMRRLGVYAGQDNNLEGSWFGNDTVWRTCIDLQRIAMYGRPDGTLATTPQRRIVSITDAIIAGEGEGPMSPTPVSSGYLTGSLNAAAAEWAHARLMGFDPRKIPLVRGSLTPFSYPLADFLPSEIRLRMDGTEIPEDEIFPMSGRTFSPAAGWKGHCELNGTDHQKSR